MKTIIIVTDKNSGSLTAFSVLTKASEHIEVPYQTIANWVNLNSKPYENDRHKVERLKINR